MVPCITTNIKETINCAEGIGVLFPLLAVLTKPQSTSEQDEERHLKSDQDLLINVTNNLTQHTHTQISIIITFSQIVDLIHSIVIGSKELEDDMLQRQGYAMLGCVLKKVPPKLLTPSFVRSLGERHSQMGGNKLLQDALFWDLGMDFTLWGHAPSETQHELINTFAANPRVSVQRLLTTIQIFYWNNSQRTQQPMQMCKEGLRPSDKELAVLRGAIFGVLRRRLEGGIPFTPTDSDAMVAFLLESGDNTVLSEALTNIVVMLDETAEGVQTAFAEALIDRGFLGCLLDLLRRSAPSVCLLAVQIICSLMFTLRTRHHFPCDSVLVSLTQGLLANPAQIELTPELYSILQGMVSEQRPNVLCAGVLPLISRARGPVRILFLHDLAAFTERDEGAAALMEYPAWYAALCRALTAPPLGQAADRETVVKLTGAIGRNITVYAALNPRFGWASLEPFFGSLRVAAGKHELIRACETEIFERVAEAFVSFVPPNGEQDTAANPRTAQAKAIIRRQGIAPLVTPLLYIVDFFFVLAPSPLKFFGSMGSDVLLQMYLTLSPSDLEHVKAERSILPRVLECIERLCRPKLPMNWGSAKTSPLVKTRSGGFAMLSATLGLRVIQLIAVDAKALSDDATAPRSFKSAVEYVLQIAEDQMCTLPMLSSASARSTDVFFFILNSLLLSYKISVRTAIREVREELCSTAFDLLSKFAPKSKDEKKALAKANDAEREVYKVAGMQERTSDALSAAISDPNWVAVKMKLTKKASQYVLAFDDDSNKLRSAYEAATQTVVAQLGDDAVPPAIVAHAAATSKADPSITVGTLGDVEISSMIAAERDRLVEFKQHVTDTNFNGSVNEKKNIFPTNTSRLTFFVVCMDKKLGYPDKRKWDVGDGRNV